MRRISMTRLPLAALLAALCMGGGGCVERMISITSQPSGALVHLNDEEVGRTPLSVPFTFYGTYDVRLEADGHQPLWTARKASAPWWETPGIDLAAELIPKGRSHIEWHFYMEPEPAPVEAALIDRATEMKLLVGDQ